MHADSTSGSLVAAIHHAGRAFRQAHERMGRWSAWMGMSCFFLNRIMEVVLLEIVFVEMMVNQVVQE